MVKGKERLAMLVIGAGMLGCNALAGIREGVFDACVDDAGDPACALVESSSSSSSGSAGTTSSGTGGPRPSCGDGILDPGEQCDDRNADADDGCTKCKIDCDELNSFRDPKTSHCFWVPLDKKRFSDSNALCKPSTGGRLATVTTEQELTLIDKRVGGPVWIGASDLGHPGTIAWLDDEPWGLASWGPGEPSHGSKDHCVVLEGEPLRFGMSDCEAVQKALCERGAIVNP